MKIKCRPWRPETKEMMNIDTKSSAVGPGQTPTWSNRLGQADCHWAEMHWWTKPSRDLLL